MFLLRRVAFANGAVVFLRPQDHDKQIGCLLDQVLNKNLVINDMSVEKAAAWNLAVHLYNMPTPGYWN
jgi:hypothetical protein